MAELTLTTGILILGGAAVATGWWLSRQLLAQTPVLGSLGSLGNTLGQKPWQDPRYRFSSLLELDQAARQGFVFDVSQAGVDDWLRLPLFSIHQARTLHQLQRSGLVFHCLDDIAAALDLPLPQLQPLAPALRFTYYEPGSIVNPLRVNPNHSDRQALLGVPGLGADLVEEILQDRVAQGPYPNLLEFQRRLRLGGDRLGDLMHYLTFH